MTAGGAADLRPRLVRGLWLAYALLALAIIAASILLRYQQLATVTEAATVFAGQLRPFEAQALTELGLSAQFYGAYLTSLEALGAFAFFAIGALIFWRRSEDRMARLMSLALVGFGLIGSPLTTPLEAVHPALAALLVGLRSVALASLVVALLLFPDGRFVPTWIRWAAIVWVLYLALSLAVPPLRLRTSAVWEDASQALVFAWALVWLLLVAAVQVYRYRVHSTPVQRQQTKWMVFGLAVGMGLMGAASAPLLLLPLWPLPLPLTTILAARLVSITIVLLAALFMPITIALSILRSHLWDIDLVIRRTLAYSLLSGLLALTYFGLVVVLQFLFRSVTGQDSQFAIALSTLAIAASFLPLRDRVQRFIDRRFYRQKYDAAEVLAGFAVTVRDETDLDRLTARLVDVVRETMQPEHLGLWLKTPNERDRRRPA